MSLQLALLSLILVGIFILYSNNRKIRKLGHVSQQNNKISYNMRRMSLSSEQPIRANLTGASMMNADLSTTDLRGSILVESNLQHAKLHNANLAGVDFSGANLSYSDLTEADVTGTKFYATNLQNANLENTKHLAEAFFNEDTVMPDGQNWNRGLNITDYVHKT